MPAGLLKLAAGCRRIQNGMESTVGTLLDLIGLRPRLAQL